MDHGATVVVVLTGLLSRCRRELVEPERTALLLLAAGRWRPGSLEVWKAGTSILPDNNPDCCMAMRMGNGDVLALLLPRSDGGVSWMFGSRYRGEAQCSDNAATEPGERTEFITLSL